MYNYQVLPELQGTFMYMYYIFCQAMDYANLMKDLMNFVGTLNVEPSFSKWSKH